MRRRKDARRTYIKGGMKESNSIQSNPEDKTIQNSTQPRRRRRKAGKQNKPDCVVAARCNDPSWFLTTRMGSRLPCSMIWPCRKGGDSSFNSISSSTSSSSYPNTPDTSSNSGYSDGCVEMDWIGLDWDEIEEEKRREGIELDWNEVRQNEKRKN